MPYEIKKMPASKVAELVTELLNEGKTAKITVTGNSMYPMLIGERDSVVLSRADNIKKGDLPLYVRNNGDVILHRIVGVKKGSFKMCGDNQKVVEYPIEKKQIIAKTVGFYRKGKYISCDNFLYRSYSFLWTNFIFLRPLFMKILKIRWRLKHEMASK